ncbi:MAG TPA: hypothetical protein VEI05_01560 [Burkholderiaceae bacterium]|nr:hypothetical protein [Burkholderiaceae bacterium]
MESTLTIKDLPDSEELDCNKMAAVHGGLMIVHGPSGAVYYMQGGNIIGVEDPATGSCY